MPVWLSIGLYWAAFGFVVLFWSVAVFKTVSSEQVTMRWLDALAAISLSYALYLLWGISP